MRETKANVIFLIAFLIISLPGAFILFNKKLDPNEPAMYLPAPIRERIPYMTPQSGQQTVERIVPPATGAWVRQVTLEQMGVGRVYSQSGIDGPDMPAMSQSRRFQVVASAGRGEGQRLGVIVWDGSEEVVWTWSAAGQHVAAGRADNTTAVPLTPSLVRELKDAGFVKPPAQVVWLEVPVPAGVLGRSHPMLTLDAAAADDGAEGWSDTFDASGLLEAAAAAAASDVSSQPSNG